MMTLRSLPLLLALPAVLLTDASRPRPSAATTLTDVSVAHRNGEAVITLALDGPVQMQEQALRNPDRIVLDFTGAAIGPLTSYDGQQRGQIRAIRARQVDGSVVRVEVELQRMQSYAMNSSSPGFIQISFPDESFTPWRANPIGPAPAEPSPQPRNAVLPAVTGPRPIMPDLPPDQVQTPLTFRWMGVSYHEVLAQLNAVGNRQLILSRGVKSEPVTMTLIDKTWQQALNAFLQSQKLSAIEIDGGIIRIDDPIEIAKLDSLERLETRQVALNYAKAPSLLTIVAGMLSKDRGTASADSATNSLIMTDIPSRLDMIVEQLNRLDVRSKQIAIEAKIVFVDRTDLEQLGVKYDLGSREQFSNRLVQRFDPSTGEPYNPNVNIVDLYGSSVSAISNADALITGSALDLIFSTAIGGYSVTAFLSALERIDMTDVEATSSITTMDNREASILAGEETPVRIIDMNSTGGVGAAPRSTVQFKETGIIVKVRPHVTNDNRIELYLDAERSSIQTLAAADLGYIIPKQHVKTTLMLGDGETGMVGGLVVSTVTRNRNGIPLLGSLPFIGSLFSFSETRENRKDLIISVTPRIVQQ